MRDEILLREVLEEDLPVFYEHQLDPDATRMAAFPSRDREAFMQHWAGVVGDAAVVRRSIVYRGRLAGYLVCFEREGERQVGYWIGKEFWGRGIASRALVEFLKCVRTRPLRARVVKHNAASLRVLEKCGFRICGEDRLPGERLEEFVLQLDRT